MKEKLMLIILSLMLVLALAACSTTEPVVADVPEAADGASGSDANISPDVNGTKAARLSGDTPLSTQLLLGTFKLEETNLAVDGTQANELLPLWKAVKSLSNSDTASSVEMDALYNQIQDVMTTNQLNQIASMEFDGESTQTLMTELGLDMEFGGRSNQNDENETGEIPSGGNRPEGMGSPGMGGPGMGGEGAPSVEQQAMMEAMTNEERATAVAGRMNGVMNPLNTMLLDPLIELLRERAVQ